MERWMRGERIGQRSVFPGLARLERKNCWQFRSKGGGESCSIVITFYIAILPPGSLNSFPGRSIRGEENRRRGFLIRPGIPFGGERRFEPRSNPRVSRFAGMRIYSFRFPSLFHSRFESSLCLLASQKELSNWAFFKISSRFILPSFRFLFSSCGENLSLKVCERGLFVKEWHISRSPSNGPAWFQDDCIYKSCVNFHPRSFGLEDVSCLRFFEFCSSTIKLIIKI